MPTGYTSIIEDDPKATFADYLWRCVHAFLGDCYDRPLDSAIVDNLKPEIEYYEEGLKKARLRLLELAEMTPGEIEKAASRAQRKVDKVYADMHTDRAALLARYDAMLAKVGAWDPPTKDHQALKDFMRRQIEVSTEGMREPLIRPKSLGPGDWYQAEVEHATRDMKYYSDEIDKAVKRTKQRNAWVAALKGVPKEK